LTEQKVNKFTFHEFSFLSQSTEYVRTETEIPN